MKNYYNEQQLADELGISLRTIQELRKTYDLKGTKIGRTWCHSKEQIDEFFRRHEGEHVGN